MQALFAASQHSREGFLESAAVRAFHADAFVLPLPPGHSFPMPKYRLLREAVAATLPGVHIHEALPASDGELALAHEPAWISAVVEGTTSAAQQREIGFPWSERMVERSRRSVGATIQAARAALAASPYCRLRPRP